MKEERKYLFGENLRKQREKKNLTQEFIAEKLGVTVKTYRSWEKNPVRIPLDIIEILCSKAVLDCDVDFLLGRIEEQSHVNKTIMQTIGISEESIDALKSDKQLSFIINTLITAPGGTDLFKKILQYIGSFSLKVDNVSFHEIEIHKEDGNTETLGPFGVASIYYDGHHITDEAIRSSILFSIRDSLETITKAQIKKLSRNQ